VIKRSTKIVGAAGEHFVMYELLRRNFVAALTPEGVPSVDILISDLSGGHLASLQVKTASAPRRTWPLSPKNETLITDRLFYCFVMPRDDKMSSPDCWIIPSDIVAEHVTICHRTWLSGKPKRGLTRADGARRAMHKNCEPFERYAQGWLDQYYDNWEILRG
jgi:hypothetical protein